MRRQTPKPYFEAVSALLQRTGGDRVLELGSMRKERTDPESVMEGASTWWFAQRGLYVTSIDIDPQATAVARRATGEFPNVECITADALEYLQRVPGPIDLLYLDAWDTGLPRYKVRHLEAYHAVRPHLHRHSLVLIDDTDVDFGGKGSLVVAAAEADGFRIWMWGRQTLLARFDPQAFGVTLHGVGPPLPYQLSFAESLKLHQQGLAWEAAQGYRHLLKREPRHPGALHLLGVASHQFGDYRAAVEKIHQAIALEGGKAVYHNNLGVSLRELKDLPAARQAFERAVAINPEYPDALSNLGLSCLEMGQLVEADSYLKRALQLQPQHIDALLHQCKLLAENRQFEAALRLVDKVMALQPQRADIHLLRAAFLREQHRLEEAVAACRQAMRLQPRSAEAHLGLGMTYAAQERAEEAEQEFAAASKLRPDRAFARMQWASLCPTVFPSLEAIETFRTRLMQELTSFAQSSPQITVDDLSREAFFPSFFLAHQGFDNRPLKEKYAAVYEPLLCQDRPAARTGRPRLGFLVTRGHEGGFLRCMAGIIERLNTKEFDVVVLASHAVVPLISQRLRVPSIEVIGFPDRLEEAIGIIQAACCDVLDHWQIGTDTMNYLLPFAPLAPLQTTGWGTHGTSGIRTVDYYISSTLMELPEADAHYTEKLLRFPTFPTWQARIPRPVEASREQFGLPAQANLYLCPHRMAKIHPDMDAVFAGILRSDPHGLVILKEGRQKYAGEKLRQRFQVTCPDVSNRIRILPEQSTADFYRLLSLADVVLDPLHYSAGLMAYDTFSLDLPLVTWPGQYLVSRYTWGYYQRLQVFDLVTDSLARYVEQAVRTATDKDYRQNLVSRLAERSDLLFEDTEAVRSYQQTFEHLLSCARSS